MIEGNDWIEIRSHMPTGQRVFLAVLALFPLYAPYDLLIRPRWTDYLNVFFLFVSVISLGAMSVSAGFFWAAIAGLSSELTIDRARRTITYTTGAPVVPWKLRRYSLDELRRVRLETHDGSDGPPSYSVVLELADGSELRSGSSESKERIEAIVGRFAELSSGDHKGAQD